MKKISFFSNDTLRFIVFIVALVGCFYAGKYFSGDVEYYKLFISNLPAYLKGFVFIFLYVGITFFAWIMKDVFKVLGAVLFGANISTLFIWIAEIINAAILFHLSRKLGRGFVERKTKGKFKGFDERVGNIGFGDLFALRAIILVPFRFLDLGIGLTKVQFRKYFTAVFLGSPIRIFIIQLCLAIFGESSQKGPAYVFNTAVEYLVNHRLLFSLLAVYIIAGIILIVRLKRIVWPKRNAA